MMRMAMMMGLTVMSFATQAATPAMVEKAMQAHGVEAWWSAQAVEAVVTVAFGGQTVLDRGHFYFEAHGPRARYEQGDVTVVYDGQTAWVSPPEAANPMLRFHVWTWPWFIYAPFKMNGDGTELSDEKTVSLQGQEYWTTLQTFAADQGDAPDDWYRLFLHPDTHRLDAMSYIVTYGKDVEEANKTPSIILYDGYKNVSGVWLATDYEFWYLDENGGLKGDSPKGMGHVDNLQVHPTVDESRFAKPDDAVELPAP